MKLIKGAGSIVRVVIAIALVAIAGCLFYGTFHMNEPQVTNSYVTGKLQNISELSTQQLTYTGVEHVTSGDIPLINKKEYNMVYTATAKAGISLSDVDVNVSDSQVKLTVPKASLQSVEIDPKSIKFYDQSFTLFAGDEKETLAKALDLAEKDFDKNADYQSLLDEADKQTAAIMKGILDGQVGNREIVVEYK